MPDFTAPAGSTVTMKVRVDKRPFLAGFQTPPDNSQWKNIKRDADGMGESRDFDMPANAGGEVDFNAQYDTQIGANDPDPKATYTITFSTGDNDKVVVPKGAGPVSVDYTFTAT